MLKDTVSINVQGFFDNNKNFILKEIAILFEKEPNLNNSYLIEPPYDFILIKYKISKDYNLVNQYTSQNFLERWRKQFSTNSKVSKDHYKRKTNYL